MRKGEAYIIRKLGGIKGEAYIIRRLGGRVRLTLLKAGRKGEAYILYNIISYKGIRNGTYSYVATY